MVDNAFARRINRGVVSANSTVSSRVGAIVAECSIRNVHLIAAQVKMPVQKFQPRSSRDDLVRIRTELDAIGYIESQTGGPGTIVVIELKTSTVNGYDNKFFKARGTKITGVRGLTNRLFDRHTVQVLFGMHCVETYREKLKLNSADKIVGLLLYSQPGSCRSQFVDPTNGSPLVDAATNERHKVLWDQRNDALFSQNRINPAQKPLKTASERRDVAFKDTTWWKTKVQEWPSLKARRPLEDALVTELDKTQMYKNKFNIRASAGNETNTHVDGFPNVSATFDRNSRDSGKLFVCVVTGKYTDTKKPDRIKAIFKSAIEAREAPANSAFVVVSQTGVTGRRRVAGAHKRAIGWKAKVIKESNIMA